MEKNGELTEKSPSVDLCKLGKCGCKSQPVDLDDPNTFKDTTPLIKEAQATLLNLLKPRE